MSKIAIPIIFALGLLSGFLLQMSACHGQTVRLHGSHGNFVGTIEQPYSWAPQRVIYDAQHNRIGTIDPAPAYGLPVVVGAPAQTVPDTTFPGDGQDPFANYGDN